MVAFTIALVASLETLLNLEAVDKIDPEQRSSPPSRELVAQGIGNVAAGLVGGIPVTSVVVRSSVNINAGACTKLSAIFHGLFLLSCVVFLSSYLNMIPLSSLAAVLLVTGFKLASPRLVKEMWSEGRYQFIPFAVTLAAIVLTDLLLGVLIGLGVSLGFILNSNLRRPLRRIVEKHIGGDVLHIELANQVSFLNRATLEKALKTVPRGTHVLLDARNTDYIDPDILSLIREFKDVTAPAHGIQVSLRGFRAKYELRDEIQFVDYSTRELQQQMSPDQVLQVLREGNERFRTGRRLTRDLGRQISATADGQHPLAVVFSCMDSRTPAELIFDLGLGDIFSVRVAGNVISKTALGSMEYGCAVAGAKLILVMGHTRCGAVAAAIDAAAKTLSAEQATGCQHLESIIHDIQQSIDGATLQEMKQSSPEHQAAFADLVARRNVERSVRQIATQSATLRRLVADGRLAVVGAVYDVATGRIDFTTSDAPQTQAAAARSI
jgi:carbonic anhydrase/SulP family sulfate permease